MTQKKAGAATRRRSTSTTPTIRAPVDGVVVSRAVDVGQTVAASLQAPTLFTIAQDLTKMQVETSVDEADIGSIRLDAPATFTVDAFPGRTFSGRGHADPQGGAGRPERRHLHRRRRRDNPEGRLLPGHDRERQLVVAEKPNVLKVAERGAPLPAAGRRRWTGDPGGRRPRRRRERRRRRPERRLGGGGGGGRRRRSRRSASDS